MPLLASQVLLHLCGRWKLNVAEGLGPDACEEVGICVQTTCGLHGETIIVQCCSFLLSWAALPVALLDRFECIYCMHILVPPLGAQAMPEVTCIATERCRTLNARSDELSMT